MPLEDDFTDIVKKARNGQGLSSADLARRCGLDAGRLAALERGSEPPSREEVAAVARGLGLRAEALAQVALEGWVPAPTPVTVPEVHTIHGDIGGYAVKGYVVCDEAAKEAALIDTGYDAEAVLSFLSARDLRLTAVCLTHGHADHAGKLERIFSTWPVPVYLGNEDEGLAPWLPDRKSIVEPAEGRTIPVGRLTVACLRTPGHTPGGICYRVRTHHHDVCFVGDTLFAGSVGRANPFSLYPAHLESVRRRVLTLPNETILFPGHGPNTTVAEELEHNPFWVAAQEG